MSERKPWAFIARKGNWLGGVASAELSNKELQKFLGSFAADGYTITPVFDRDEYNAAIRDLDFPPHFRRQRTSHD